MESPRNDYYSRNSMSSDETKRFLPSDDMDTPVVRPAKRQNPWLSRGVAVTGLNVALFLAAVGVWSHVHVLLRSFDCDAKPRQDHFEPDLLYDTRVTFQPHNYYGGAPDNHTDEMWQRLSPPGDGIVEVPNAFTYSLPASLPAPNNPETHKVYGVSMFHQLHCLNFLRFAYYPETMADSMEPHEITAHRDHCLDYIRQAIMCAGDSTFEPLTVVGINGMGATHQCRNFERLFSWAYDHRSDKKKGSGYKGGVVTHTPGHRNDFVEGDEGAVVPAHHSHESK
ncbi:uncharacterized protein B0I36DRAFT_434935 [Microdochium trichocladiopsis]|uniref:Tat pathway signal sequence n=1 Tax=Microdochium trichocladiopsis TaxID=1682393 RepID=A0A9P9BHY2_9PEZI|nr:uncharacterized protein B0I36DRAFT_434935 [Microdochium trichocladiopsis]KAH7021010.1 hypothetical protein B0I36DRAFT_434935 [Microdochium trichocladiopsis]